MDENCVKKQTAMILDDDDDGDDDGDADDDGSEDDLDVSDMKDDESDAGMDENCFTKSVSQLSDLTTSCNISNMTRKHSMQADDEETLSIFGYITEHGKSCACLKNLVSPQEWFSLDLKKIHAVIKSARRFVLESFNHGNSKKGNNAVDYFRNLLRGDFFLLLLYCIIFF
jgi:hypothetical protein